MNSDNWNHFTFLSTEMNKHKEQCNSTDLNHFKILTCPMCPFIATKTWSMELHQIVHNTKTPSIIVQNVNIKHLFLIISTLMIKFIVTTLINHMVVLSAVHLLRKLEVERDTYDLYLVI